LSVETRAPGVDERLRGATQHVEAGRDLDRAGAAAAVGRLLDRACDPRDAASFLVALAAKGATAAEIAGAVDAIRSSASAVSAVDGAVDIVGTGGDGLQTINVSTVAAIVAAAAGATVAKAGNRAATSACGSADVLEAMGIDIEPGLARIPALLRRKGFAFVYTPAVHPELTRLAPLRRRLGVRTVFNLTGPLTNPFVTGARVIGTATSEDQESLAGAASVLGFTRTWVVHSADGMDELSTSALTDIIAVDGARMTRTAVDPAVLPLARGGPAALRGGDPRRNAALAGAVLAGDAPPELADPCMLNAAALLHVAGHAETLDRGLAAARAAVADGRAAALLERLRTP
jgi:anthranilate phosphoribosyltransferase